MTFEVRWLARARRQVLAGQEWWVSNRDVASTAFRDEVARFVVLLQDNPELGVRVRGRDVRRILLPESELFIYYRIRPRARAGPLRP